MQISTRPTVIPGSRLLGPREEIFLVTDCTSVEEFFAAFPDADKRHQTTPLAGATTVSVKFHTSRGTKTYRAHVNAPRTK